MTTLIILGAGSATLSGKLTCIAVHPDGKYLFEKCISGINLTGIDRIIISVLESDNLKFGIEQKIRESFNGKIELCAIPFKTKSPAETVYCTINQMKISGRILIKDVDNFFSAEDISYENFVAGLDILDYDIRRLGNKSFITVNEQNYILDIIEKRVKSGIICTGFYGFKSAQDFLKVYDALKDEMYDIEKIYVSHVVAYMIGRFGEIFKYIQVRNFESYDNQEDWNDVLNYFKKSQAAKNKLAIFYFDETAQKNQHLFEFIELLKSNYYIALVTTAPRKNLEGLFDKIFIQENAPNLKECYLKAIEYFKVKPENTIIFEDFDGEAFYCKIGRFNGEI